MGLHDYHNIRRVFRTMAAEWNCPVWMVKRTVRKLIDQSWEKSLSDSNTKALWNTYFPNGKPTPEQYILRLGHAHETGEDIPYLLCE